MPIPTIPLSRGDRGSAVAQLHRTLEAINRAIKPTERDGRLFGAATESVLRKFQKQSAIRVTGVFDADTQAANTRMLADLRPLSVYGKIEGSGLNS